MNRPVIFLLGVMLAAGATSVIPLQAQEDDGLRALTGEVEEIPEMAPATVIPWHDSLLELPQWMTSEVREIEHRTRPANHGAGLFPEEVWPLQPEPVQGPLIWDDAPAALPRGPVPPAEITPQPLGPELLALYTDQKPAGVLVDPQHLVPSGRIEPLVQRWLNEQCVFRTTVLLFGAGQQLPADFDPQALRRQWFGDSGDDLLVFYFLHEPQRTLAIFGQEARSRYGADMVRSVVDAAVTEAGRVNGGPEQLERFCYKMSVRLHWMARTVPNPGIAAMDKPGQKSTAQSLRMAAWAALAGAGVIAAGLLLTSWYRKRRIHEEKPSRPEPVFLPEFESCPRFGAPHSGGFSSLITFSQASGNPAASR